MLKRFLLSLAVILSVASDVWADSAIYACGHMRRERTITIPKLKMSGYTTVILFNLNVEADASLCTDYNWATQEAREAGGIVCRNGEYIFDRFQPYYTQDIKDLLTPPTSVNRVEICIGGWTNGSYGHIKNLINAYGTGEETELYRNFKALHEAIPEIVAVNNDQEQDYDVEIATAFHKMLAKIGFKTSVAPYTNKNFWQRLVSNLNEEPGTVDMVYLQTYAGGANNKPQDWQVFGDVPMWVGFDCEASGDIDAMKQLMQNFNQTGLVSGGFLWNYNNEARNVNEWATTINRIFDSGAVRDEDAAVTLYEKRNYGGYSVKLAEGIYNQGDLAARGIPVKGVMSLQVGNGYKVTLDSGSDLDGVLQEEFTGNKDYIGPKWVARGVCSLKIEKNDDGGSGVSELLESSDLTPEIYDLSGRKVSNIENLMGGVYIVKKGSSIIKQIIK
ncbi:MAG: T9SS type A sorting domain-containing protein [Muribaculaceae bacterium]|nr:T9SS type A sorting domain-containing protein [Muribaculaceae bacterium]